MFDEHRYRFDYGKLLLKDLINQRGKYAYTCIYAIKPTSFSFIFTYTHFLRWIENFFAIHLVNIEAFQGANVTCPRYTNHSMNISGNIVVSAIKSVDRGTRNGTNLCQLLLSHSVSVVTLYKSQSTWRWLRCLDVVIFMLWHKRKMRQQKKHQGFWTFEQDDT